MRGSLVCLPGFLQGAKNKFFSTVKQDKKMQCVVPENIHTPPPPPPPPLPHGGQRQFREEGCPKGDNFRGGGAGRLFKEVFFQGP